MLAREGEHFSSPVESGGHSGRIASVLNDLVVSFMHWVRG